MNHPPKPFTDEWCRLHPGQGQCPDDIVSVPIDSELWTYIGIFSGVIIGFFMIYFYNKSKNNILMKQKLKMTVKEFVSLNTIEEEVNIDVYLGDEILPKSNRLDIVCKIDSDGLKKACECASKSFIEFHKSINLLKRKSRFERLYDSVTNFLSGGKSFAPNELKSFR